MSTLAEQLKNHINNMSPGERDKFFESITHVHFKKRWVEKIHALSKEKRAELIEKCRGKYSSEKYKEKEWSKGYEPREELFAILNEYAIVHGADIFNEREGMGDVLDFCSSLRLVDDTYIVEMLCGQGTVINVFTIDEWEDFQKKLKSQDKQSQPNKKAKTYKWEKCTGENYWSDDENIVTVVKMPFEDDTHQWFETYMQSNCPFGWSTLIKSNAEMANIEL